LDILASRPDDVALRQLIAAQVEQLEAALRRDA
jgi:hypothetical protein